jgi:VanZ family protein
LVFATVLQIAQIWLPTRSAAISDVVWNALGLAVGIATFRWAQSPILWLSKRLRSPHLLAFLLALFWLTLQWWPLLPLLQRTLLRTAWDRLRHLSDWTPLPAVLAALAFMVLMHLLRDLRGRFWVAVSLLFVAQVGLFFFVHKSGAVASEPSNVLGWLLGLVLGVLCWSLSAQAANRVVLLAAAAGGLLSSLQPFEFGATALPFQLIPVVGLFNEPRVAHTSAFLWAAFWILAVLLLAQRHGWRLPANAAVLTLVVAGLEVLQRWLPGQQADITSLLLPAACAWFLSRLLRRQQRLQGSSPPTI